MLSDTYDYSNLNKLVFNKKAQINLYLIINIIFIITLVIICFTLNAIYASQTKISPIKKKKNIAFKIF